MPTLPNLDITKDTLEEFRMDQPAFVAMGEVMVRDTPADDERPERTREVHLSMAGSEYTLAIGLSRLGIPSSYITRVPDNPYGRAVQNVARAQGVNTEHIVWAPKAEPIGRLIYEIGRTPRRNRGVYQRMYSAASRLGAGMVDWEQALVHAKLFHTSGITFGLASHSKYAHNPLFETFLEALMHKPEDCLVGLDFNYRATLWSPDMACEVMTPLLKDHVDILITTIEDMAKLYDIDCGQYSAKQIVNGIEGYLEDDDIKAFSEEVLQKFDVKLVAITIRYPDTFEQHRWESATLDADGNFFRSPSVYNITLWDRLGGGDTWNAGFYYGLLTGQSSAEGMRRGVLTGDAATRIKQTLMFDLPIVEKQEVQMLLKADVEGGGKRTER